jgi:signal transduction histidine kinase
LLESQGPQSNGQPTFAGAPQNHAVVLVTKQLPTPSRRAADMATNPQGCRPATYACRPRDGERVEIRVQDDGRGIPRERLGDIFEPFIQTQLGRGAGLGIGLDMMF